MTELSRGLAEFITTANPGDAGPDAVDLAKRVIVDTIAVILSGAGSDVDKVRQATAIARQRRPDLLI